MSYPEKKYYQTVGCKFDASKPLFKEISDITTQQLDELKLTMNWFIMGYGIHGLQTSDLPGLRWEWIKKNYSVDEYYCLHKKVSDIGYVVACDETTSEMGKFYDGYCECCGRTVHGFIGYNGTKRRWN